MKRSIRSVLKRKKIKVGFQSKIEKFEEQLKFLIYRCKISNNFISDFIKNDGKELLFFHEKQITDETSYIQRSKANLLRLYQETFTRHGLIINKRSTTRIEYKSLEKYMRQETMEEYGRHPHATNLRRDPDLHSELPRNQLPNVRLKFRSLEERPQQHEQPRAFAGEVHNDK
jgi:hypothetical protein